ncbi:glycosyl hydrolase [Curtobacterium flaccumfaciens]|nr:glycosyl hydrolase [Curtobacterium flaccumfaciens]
MKRRTFLSASAASAGLVIAPRVLEGGSTVPAAAAAGPSGHGHGHDTAVAASNVFVEPARPRLTIPGAQAGDVVTVTATLPGGDVAWKGTVRVASAKTAQVAVPVGRGYYDIAYSIARGTGTAAASDSFCVLSRLGRTVPGLGVNTHFGFTDSAWQPEVLAPLVATAGIATVRDTEEWGGAEPTKGVYDFTDYRTYRQVLVRNGLTDLPVLSFNNANYDGGATPYTDEGRAGFAQYAVHLVAQNPHVEYVEVFNEWNSPTFGDRGDGPADCRSDYYFLLLQATVTELRKHYPKLKYVAPATSGVPIDWLKDVFDRGGLDYLDAVSIHPYCYPAAPDQLAQQVSQVQQLIGTYGKRRDVWITELGWTSADTQLSVDTRYQASYAVQGAAAAYASGVKDFFWYDFMDDGTSASDTEDNFGMVATVADGSTRPKPVYVAYANLARQLASGHRASSPTGLVQDAPPPGCRVWHCPAGAVELDALGSGTHRVRRAGGDARDVHGHVRCDRAPHPGRRGRVAHPRAGTGLRRLGAAARGGQRGTARTRRARRQAWRPAHRDVDRPQPRLAPDHGSARGRRRGGRVRRRPGTEDGDEGGVLRAGGDARPADRARERHRVGPDGRGADRRVRRDGARDPVGAARARRRQGPAAHPARERERHHAEHRLPGVDDRHDHRERLGHHRRRRRHRRQARGRVRAHREDAVHRDGGVRRRLDAHRERQRRARGRRRPPARPPEDDHGRRHERAVRHHADGQPDRREQQRRDHRVQRGVGPVGRLLADVRRRAALPHGRRHGRRAARHGDGRPDLAERLRAVLGERRYPGEASSWDEIGASLVGSDVVTWRWSGPAVGPLAPGAVAVSRSGTVTTYEAGMAWDDLGIDPSGGLVSFSMVVNDNDGAGRKGYIEWASGIGNGKDSALFRGFVLDA